MADTSVMVRQLAEAGFFSNLVNNPMAMFGRPNRNYLGATILPERPVPENSYLEESINFRTVIANDGTRYNAVQKKGNVISGSMRVELGNQDIGSVLTAKDYDAFIRLMRQSTGTQGQLGNGVVVPSMEALQRVTDWVDTTLNLPLRERIELQRWQAIVSASVVRTGDDGYNETVSYPAPAGHRVNAGGAWSSNSYDPYADIIAGAELLATKGYTVNRVITGTDVRSKLSLNANMSSRAGRVIIQSGNAVNKPAGRATLEDLNTIFGTDGIPAIELYDLQYRTQTSSGFFLPRGTFVMIATTGRDESIDRADAEPLTLTDTLGYAAVGRAAGQENPGRVVHVEHHENKPPRLEGEAWQTSLPVITDPEAIFVISGIS